MEGVLFNKFGFNWRLGQHWGVADPKHNCYATEEAIISNRSNLMLGIVNKPETFNGQVFNWGVGYVSSIEKIKYGSLTAFFTLPEGSNLWPAIWLTDAVTWPPEIDILEAWSNKKGTYRRTLWGLQLPVNDIFPSIHYGDTDETHKFKSYKNCLKGTSPLLIGQGVNKCKLIWTPDKVEVYYNNTQVAKETDKNILSWLNKSEGMEIILNNFVTNDFTEKDFKNIKNKFLSVEIYYDSKV